MKGYLILAALALASISMAENLRPQNPAVLLDPVKAPAPIGYAGRFYYDVKDHLVYGVAAAKLTTFSVHKHPGWSLDLEAFAGAGLKDGRVCAGFDLGKTWDIFANAKVFAGVGFKVDQGALPVSAGPMLGVTVKF